MCIHAADVFLCSRLLGGHLVVSQGLKPVCGVPIQEEEVSNRTMYSACLSVPGSQNLGQLEYICLCILQIARSPA